MQLAPSFLCDEMLAGLARWLRAAGYDTSRAESGTADGVLVALARIEGRLLLTRDRAMSQRRAAASLAVVLPGGELDAWARELTARLALDWRRAPFTRCLICNTPLAAPPREAFSLVPINSRALRPLKWCPCCAKPFWPGGHVERMQARLERWARGD